MADAEPSEDGVPGSSVPRTGSRRRPAAMVDVARLAGVSHQTVSRVINESERVAPDTRKRVLRAMRMLDYRPSSLARALVTGRSRTIGLISFSTTLFGPASMLFGVERAAHEADYFTSIVAVPVLDSSSVSLAVDRLRSGGVEGIIAVTPHEEAIGALAGVAGDIPLVAVEAGPDQGVALVAVDQRAGALAATNHLLGLGHGTVHHIAGPRGWQEAERRVAGWSEALRAHGAPVPPPAIGDWSSDSGYALGRELAGRSEVSAVFVANDQMALGVLRALHETGRQVPDDVSLVGFDAIPESAFFTPPLTTVRQDFLEIGRAGFGLLRDQIEDGHRFERRVIIRPQLVVRASTGRPEATARRTDVASEGPAC